MAEFNIGRLKYPADDPRIESFVVQLDAVNALADEWPGFVWRFKAADQGDSRVIKAYDDPLIIANLSVWESLQSLQEYTYQSVHRKLLQDRMRWFERLEGPSFVLWWIPAGHLPTLQEGVRKLEHLKSLGPCPRAFSFREPFPPPGAG